MTHSESADIIEEILRLNPRLGQKDHPAIEAMKEAQVFITGFGMPFRKALDGAKIAKEEFGMLTLCNTSPLPSEPMGDLSYLDFIVLNDIEARVLCGLPEDSDKPGA